MSREKYVKGTHNAICDICGFKFKRSEMRKTWDNLLVCETDYSPKHPQLIVRPPRERVGVKDARLENPDVTLGALLQESDLI